MEGVKALKTSGEFHGFDQAGKEPAGTSASRHSAVASDPQDHPFWELRLREDLNPGKAPSCLPL